MEKLNTINYSEEVKIFGNSAENSEARENKSSIPLNKQSLAVLFFLLVLLPEALVYFGIAKAALQLYAFILTALSISSIFVKDDEIRNICQVLMLLPIFRLINLSMLVFPDTPLISFVFIYTPMLVPLVILAAKQQFTYEQLGLNIKGQSIKNVWYYFPISVLIGLVLGGIEYFTVETKPLITHLSFINILELMLVMILFVGVIEEIIFRSVIQTRLEEFLGMREGLILTSLLFGLMNSGYGTIQGILFACLVGLLIGYIFQRTRSLPLVALIHGFINVFSFGIIPLLLH